MRGLAKVPFYKRKLVPGTSRVTHLPELPRGRQLFLHFLNKRGEPFTWERKKRKMRLELFIKGHLPSRATFLNVNTSARSVGLTPSRPDNREFKQRFFFQRRTSTGFLLLYSYKDDLLKTLFKISVQEGTKHASRYWRAWLKNVAA